MEGLLTDAPQIGANDLLMAKNMADLLHRHYPGHLWGVHVDGKQGIATIRNMALSGNMGYLLHLPAIYSASEFDARVVRAGGEILERYRQRRASANPDHIEAVPMDFAGRLKFDKD
jgi:hypothetical protein